MTKVEGTITRINVQGSITENGYTEDDYPNALLNEDGTQILNDDGTPILTDGT